MIARSADGTPIAFERSGTAPPVVLVAGAACDRSALRPLMEALGDAVVYDRRGRGDSGDTQPYAVEREIEDLAAVIDAVGGGAAVYGHSSGAGLALRAAAAGLPITRLILHEPPYATPETAEESRAFASEMNGLIAAGRTREALEFFFAGVGMDPSQVDPALDPLAHTLAYDSAVMGDADGAQVPADLLPRVEVPVLVLLGGASYGFMAEPARAIAEGVPDGRLEVLEGADHVGDPAQVAAAIRSGAPG